MATDQNDPKGAQDAAPKPRRHRRHIRPKRGRPRWQPTAENIKQVEALAARGLTYQDIADTFGISIPTLIARRRELFDFSEAIRRGRGSGRAIAGGVIFDAMTKSPQEYLRVSAAQFYLGRRGGWTDRDSHVEVNINGQPVSLDDEAQARERQAALIRLLTPDERVVYLDLMARAARRQLTGEPVS